MYTSNDVKKTVTSLFNFYLGSCSNIFFIKKWKTRVTIFLVITVLRKWVLYSIDECSRSEEKLSLFCSLKSKIPRTLMHFWFWFFFLLIISTLNISLYQNVHGTGLHNIKVILSIYKIFCRYIIKALNSLSKSKNRQILIYDIMNIEQFYVNCYINQFV